MGYRELYEANKIILETSLQSFFFVSLFELNAKSTNPLPKETIYYSSKVLDDYAHSNDFFEVKKGKVKEKVLGLKLLESNHQSKSKQKRVLRDIGDTALVICGVFHKSLNKKLVDAKYYQSLGETAYHRLDAIIPDVYEVPSFFGRMSKSFESLTFMIASVSEKLNMNCSMDDDLLLFISDNNKIKVS